jgi:hypothetical protein
MCSNEAFLNNIWKVVQMEFGCSVKSLELSARPDNSRDVLPAYTQYPGLNEDFLTRSSFGSGVQKTFTMKFDHALLQKYRRHRQKHIQLINTYSLMPRYELVI